MKLVTVATHSERYFPILIESCKKYNIQLDVLGWNQEWKGFAMRYSLMKEYLDSLPDYEIVCFIDSYDVIMLKPLQELENKFVSMNADIVVAHDTGIFHRFIFGSCRNIKINAGTYIGYAYYLKKMISQICIDNDCTDKRIDDQILLTKYCNENHLYVDTQSILFFTKKYNTACKVINQQLSYNNTYPCIIHGPGYGNLDNILEQLGYDVTQVKHKKIDYIIKRCKHHFVLVAVIIVILLLTIVTIFLFLFKIVDKK